MGGGVDRSTRPHKTAAEAISEHAARVDPGHAGDPRSGSHDATEWLDVCCPYLRSADGTWRSVVPQRGQRCWGQVPPAPLEPVTQERLCRTQAHTTCEIYHAAESRRSDALARDHLSSEQLDGRFGVLVRPAPLVLDAPVQARVHINADRRTRVAAALAGAGGVVLVALLAGLGSGTPAATQQPPPIAAVSPSASPVPPVATEAPASTPTATAAEPSAAPEVTPTPTVPVATEPPLPTSTVGPVPTATPGIARRYRVHPGDTLQFIADKFGLTKKQILAVNDLGDPPQLRYGTFINIPFP